MPLTIRGQDENVDGIGPVVARRFSCSRHRGPWPNDDPLDGDEFTGQAIDVSGV